jgi:hypothetical protein
VKSQLEVELGAAQVEGMRAREQALIGLLSSGALTSVLLVAIKP